MVLLAKFLSTMMRRHALLLARGLHLVCPGLNLDQIRDNREPFSAKQRDVVSIESC
jgi:hypothetical protein